MPKLKTTDTKRQLINWSPYIRLVHDYPEVGTRGARTITRSDTGDHAFHYFHAGKGEYQLDGETRNIVPGSLFIVRPGHPFSFTVEPASAPHMLNIHFDLVEQADSFFPHPYLVKNRQSASAQLPESIPGKVLIDNRKTYENIFFELHSIFLMPETNWELKKKSLMLELIAIVFESCRNIEKSNRPEHHLAVKKALDFIYNNLGQKISLQDIVKSSGICRALLIKLFKQECGLTPVKFAYKAKIEQAKNILSSGEIPIKAVADQLGFADIYHFSRIFKEITGTPPGAYRNAIFRQTDK